MLHEARVHELARLGQSIDEYEVWAETRWATSTLPGIDTGLASELVMGFGLGGETGEVADEVLALGKGNEGAVPDNLFKEMGDSFYYFCRLTKTFGLRASVLFAEKHVVPESDLKSQTLSMVVAAGKVQEACKKYVRDGVLNREKLEDGLLDFVTAWRGLCARLEVHPLEIIRLNRDKIETRHAKGTVRGSGNDR